MANFLSLREATEVTSNGARVITDIYRNNTLYAKEGLILPIALYDRLKNELFEVYIIVR